MKPRILAAVAALFFASVALAGNPTVEMQTSKGTIVLELYPDKAPESVENFLEYVNDGFYNDTVFHRVIPNFMIQGGGFTARMKQKETQPPVVNESNNGLKNDRGTLAMARTSAPHSAASQFYINLKDNPDLNHGGGERWGYAVFGRVTRGMEIVDEISREPTGIRGEHHNVPLSPIYIRSVKVLSDK
jgi:peptidyl-prolyl cis-trans isomerase A (cyclophilin A)